MTPAIQTDTIDHRQPYRPKPSAVRRIIAKRSYATVATTSPAGYPHVVGVLYELVEDTLYFHTMRASRKGRNIAASGKLSLCIPVRRLPVGPPSAVHFQTTARLVDPDSTEIRSLVAGGKLRSISKHGELDEPEGTFVAIDLPRRVLTYGLGMSIIRLIKAPLEAAGEVIFEA